MTLALTISALSLLTTLVLGMVGVVRENRRDNERTRERIVDDVRLELRANFAEHIAACPLRVAPGNSSKVVL